MARALLIIGVLLVTGATTADEAATAEAAELRNRLLDEAATLQSFSGEYLVTQINTIGKDFRERHNFRFSGDNQYLSTTELDPAKEFLILTHSLFEGRLTTRIDRDFGVQGVVGRTHWPNPVGARVNPRIFFEGVYEKTWEEIFSQGSSKVYRIDEFRVLSHRGGPDRHAVDVYFDADGRVRRIDHVTSTTYSESQIRAFYSGDLFDVKRIGTTLELNDYTEINGIEFPSTAVKTFWGYEEKAREALQKDFDTGKISEVEFMVRLYTEVKVVAAATQVVEFDLQTIAVNDPLPPESFEIDFPHGATVSDYDRGIIYRVGVGIEGKIQKSFLERAQNFGKEFFGGQGAPPKGPSKGLTIADVNPNLRRWAKFIALATLLALAGLILQRLRSAYRKRSSQ